MSLEITIFDLKMMVKSGLEFFYFEIHRAPLEIPANMLGQFSLLGQMFLHWAAATLKGLVQFQNKKNSRPLFTIIFKPKIVLSRVFSLLILAVLGGVLTVQAYLYTVGTEYMHRYLQMCAKIIALITCTKYLSS